MQEARTHCLARGHEWSRAPFWKSMGWGAVTVVLVSLIFGATRAPSVVVVLVSINNGVWAILFAALIYERRGVPCRRCGILWHKHPAA